MCGLFRLIFGEWQYSSPYLPDIKACAVTDRTPTGADTSHRSQHLNDCREIWAFVWTSAFEIFFFCMSSCPGCWLDSVGLLWSISQVNVNVCNIINLISDWKILMIQTIITVLVLNNRLVKWNVVTAIQLTWICFKWSFDCIIYVCLNTATLHSA